MDDLKFGANKQICYHLRKVDDLKFGANKQLRVILHRLIINSNVENQSLLKVKSNGKSTRQKESEEARL